MLPTEPFWLDWHSLRKIKNVWARAKPSTWRMINEAGNDATMLPTAATDAISSAKITLNYQDGLYNPVVFDNWDISPNQFWTDILDDATIARIRPEIVKDDFSWWIANHDDAVRIMKAMSKEVIPYTFTVEGKSIGENWIWDHRGPISRFFEPSHAFAVWYDDHEMVPKARRCACPAATLKRRKR